METIPTALWASNSLPHYIYTPLSILMISVILTFTPFDFNISPKLSCYINLIIFFGLFTYYTFHHFLTYGKLTHHFYFIIWKIFQPYTIMLHCYYMCSELINSFNYSSLLATCFHYQAFLNIYSILILTNHHAMDTLGTLHPSPNLHASGLATLSGLAAELWKFTYLSSYLAILS